LKTQEKTILKLEDKEILESPLFQQAVTLMHHTK